LATAADSVRLKKRYGGRLTRGVSLGNITMGSTSSPPSSAPLIRTSEFDTLKVAPHGTLKRMRPFLKANTDSQLLATDDVRPEDKVDEDEDDDGDDEEGEEDSQSEDEEEVEEEEEEEEDMLTTITASFDEKMRLLLDPHYVSSSSSSSTTSSSVAAVAAAARAEAASSLRKTSEDACTGGLRKTNRQQMKERSASVGTPMGAAAEKQKLALKVRNWIF
jgi:hypothetical protein